MIKRIFAILLPLLLCAGIVACDSGGTVSETTDGDTSMITDAPATDKKPPAFIDIDVSEDSTVRGGKYSKDNYGKEVTVDIKGTNDDYARKAYLKFSL